MSSCESRQRALAYTEQVHRDCQSVMLPVKGKNRFVNRGGREHYKTAISRPMEIHVSVHSAIPDCRPWHCFDLTLPIGQK